MERTIKQELKPMGKPKHKCRICKGRFSCGQELDEHMQSHRLNNGEATTCEPLCISEFFSRNSNFESGGCSSVVGAAGSGEPVDGNPHPPPQLSAKDEDVVHCLLVLSNSGSECANVPNQNLSATPAGYECDNCNMVFPSHQALGGHRASHKSVEGCFVGSLKIRSADANNKRIENQNNNVDNQNNMARPSPENMALPIVPLAEYSLQLRLPSRKDPKPHICKECHQHFPTCQALGGHMRCHQIALNITATAATTTGTAASVNLMTTAATAKVATATTFAPDAQIGASSSEVNEIQLHMPTLPPLFKNPHLNINQNMPAEPTNNIDGSSLQLCFCD
ncbi:zinc finger protein ZAT2-like [Phalaenopsis equestris]|uniref:zinc finger protein ZAT2-like n=1 Tax=Phalaenopsis equestris TaxID=78828 RepID=UPI0009E55076|nr:zinc finger protein ZAT2-like [Phalaenopsis equestris]